MDRLLDTHAAVGPVLPFLRLDRRFVGQLLVKLEKDLFARDLGREQAQRQIRGLILGIEEGPGRQCHRRRRPGRRERRRCLSALTMKVRSNGSRAFSSEVRASRFSRGTTSILLRIRKRGARHSSAFDDRAGFRADATFGIDDQRHDIGVFRATPGGGHHGALQTALGDPEYARRITRITCARAPSARSAMAMPITRMRVVWTLGDTMLTFDPTMALTRVDLPALGAPTMATKPARVFDVVIARFTFPTGRLRPGVRPRACCRRAPAPAHAP